MASLLEPNSQAINFIWNRNVYLVPTSSDIIMAWTKKHKSEYILPSVKKLYYNTIKNKDNTFYHKKLQQQPCNIIFIDRKTSNSTLDMNRHFYFTFNICTIKKFKALPLSHSPSPKSFISNTSMLKPALLFYSYQENENPYKNDSS